MMSSSPRWDTTSHQWTYTLRPSAIAAVLIVSSRPSFLLRAQRMSLDAFSGVLTWCLRQSVGEITLLGGEPSLHPSFAEMVATAYGQGLDVRVVTNGARRFQRLMEDGVVGPDNLSRVAVSLDTLDEEVQDGLRGRGAWRDAMDMVRLLGEQGVLFDINVTGVRSVLAGLDALIRFADESGCRRVNVHWPSSIGLGRGLAAEQIPGAVEWLDLVTEISKRAETRPDLFVEIERGFLAEGEPLTECALPVFSNLQILPDGRAYRCGLLVNQIGMASLAMRDDQLLLTRPGFGEDRLQATMSPECASCPAMQADGRRACIYDKVSSVRLT